MSHCGALPNYRAPQPRFSERARLYDKVCHRNVIRRTQSSERTGITQDSPLSRLRATTKKTEPREPPRARSVAQRGRTTTASAVGRGHASVRARARVARARAVGTHRGVAIAGTRVLTGADRDARARTVDRRVLPELARAAVRRGGVDVRVRERAVDRAAPRDQGEVDVRRRPRRRSGVAFGLGDAHPDRAIDLDRVARVARRRAEVVGGCSGCRSRR